MCDDVECLAEPTKVRSTACVTSERSGGNRSRGPSCVRGDVPATRAACMALLLSACSASNDSPFGGAGAGALGPGATSAMPTGTAAGAAGAGATTGSATTGVPASAGASATGTVGTTTGGLATGSTEGLSVVPIHNDPKRVISRLTRSQFLNSAAALLGEAALTGVAELLPEPVPNGGFGNSGFAQGQTYDVIVAYDAAARQLVGNVTDWAALRARYGGCASFDCADSFVMAFGTAAFRRPMLPAEVTAVMPIVQLAQSEGLGFDAATALVIRALVQSPEFLYHFEDDVLTEYQLASRISFFVTDGPPDAELYAAADAGTLSAPDQLTTQVDRLLAASGGDLGRAFVYDFLGLRRAYQRVVDYDDSLLDALVDSARETFASFLENDVDVGALFVTPQFVVNDATAGFMGVTANAGVVQSTGDGDFLGLLTHPATLIAMSNAIEGSTVSRGQFIAHQLLCVPPTPPPQMAFTPDDVGVELPPNPTQRDEAEARLQDPSCSACHIQFEPYAFALNKWGGDGLYKTDERLLDDGPITTSLGQFTFAGYRDFLPLLAGSEQYRRCITDQFLRYGFRHTDYPSELVDSVLATATSPEGSVTFRALARAIVLEEAFKQR